MCSTQFQLTPQLFPVDYLKTHQHELIPLDGSIVQTHLLPELFLQYHQHLDKDISSIRESTLATLGTTVVSSVDHNVTATPDVVFHQLYNRGVTAPNKEQWVTTSTDINQPQFIGYVFKQQTRTLTDVALLPRLNTNDTTQCAPYPKVFTLEGRNTNGRWSQLTTPIDIPHWEPLKPVKLKIVDHAHEDFYKSAYTGFRIVISDWDCPDTKLNKLATGLHRVYFKFLEDKDNIRLPHVVPPSTDYVYCIYSKAYTKQMNHTTQQPVSISVIEPKDPVVATHMELESLKLQLTKLETSIQTTQHKLEATIQTDQRLLSDKTSIIDTTTPYTITKIGSYLIKNAEAVHLDNCFLSGDTVTFTHFSKLDDTHNRKIAVSTITDNPNERGRATFKIACSGSLYDVPTFTAEQFGNKVTLVFNKEDNVWYGYVK